MTIKLLQISILIFFFVLPGSTKKKEVVPTLEIFDIEKNERTEVVAEDAHFEVPKWSIDGKFILINQNASLFKIYLNGKKEKLVTVFADRCNNDHGISPDGKKFAFISYAYK